MMILEKRNYILKIRFRELGKIQNFTQVVKILLHKGGTNGVRLHLNDKDSPRVINRIRKNGKLELAGLVEIRKISEKEVGK